MLEELGKGAPRTKKKNKIEKGLLINKGTRGKDWKEKPSVARKPLISTMSHNLKGKKEG